MNDEPTNYTDQLPIEPTQGVYNNNPYINTSPYYDNPYINTGPYYQDIPPIPPPPPKQPKKRGRSILLLWAISITGLLLILSVIFFGINGLPWQSSHIRTVSSSHSLAPTTTGKRAQTGTTIPTPTAISVTPTPLITGAKAPYPAEQIAGDFYQAGLAPLVSHVDTSWSCCHYYPEGGAVYWSDLQTGISMDIATFASIDEAQIDGRDLSNKGFNGYVTNYCLLSYGGNPSDLQSYLSIMAQVCIYE